MCIVKGAIYDDEIKCILRVALLGPLEHGRVFLPRFFVCPFRPQYNVCSIRNMIDDLCIDNYVDY